MTDPGQFFDPAMFNQFQQANPGAQANPAQFYGGQPAYAPPPAPQGYAPQGGQYPPQAPPPPQAYYGPQGAPGGPYGPPQGYAPPPQYGGYAPPAPAPMVPTVQGTMDDFFNQSGGAGKSLAFEQLGQTYTVAVKRDLVQGDVRQRTDPNTKQPVFGNDGKPKFSLVVPLVKQSDTDPSQLEDCSWWMSAADKDALVEALTKAAGRKLQVPNKGTVLRITYVRNRPNRPPFQPTKVKEVQVLKLGDGWEEHASPLPGLERVPTHIATAEREVLPAAQAQPESALHGFTPADEAQAVAAFAAQQRPQDPVPGQPVYAEASSPAYAQQGQQWAMQPGPHGGPMAVPPQAQNVPMDPASQAAFHQAAMTAQQSPHPVQQPQPAPPQAQPAVPPPPAGGGGVAAGPGEDMVMAKMTELLGGK